MSFDPTRPCGSYTKKPNKYSRSELQALAVSNNISNYKAKTLTTLCDELRVTTTTKNMTQTDLKSYKALCAHDLQQPLHTLVPKSWIDFLTGDYLLFEYDDTPPEPIQLACLVLQSKAPVWVIDEEIDRWSGPKLVKALLAYVTSHRFPKPRKTTFFIVNAKTGKQRKRAFTRDSLADITLFELLCWISPYSSGFSDEYEELQKKRLQERVHYFKTVRQWLVANKDAKRTIVDMLCDLKVDLSEIKNMFKLHAGTTFKGRRKPSWMKDTEKIGRLRLGALY